MMIASPRLAVRLVGGKGVHTSRMNWSSGRVEDENLMELGYLWFSRVS